MPVYNGEKYLREAMDSILGQTFTDFEFIIINDGSTDQSAEIISLYTDRRIILIHNDQNLGITASLNRGLDVARGEYLARMDCDDISLPERLAKQVMFMDANPAVGACGTWALDIDPVGNIIGKWETLVGEQLDNFYWRTSLIHPAAMFRFTEFGELRYDRAAAEDYDLWFRIRAKRKLDNLPEYLLLYRVHDESISATKADIYIHMAYDVFCRNLGTRATYEEFLALMGYSQDVSPIRRTLATMRLAKSLRKPYRIFLSDDIEYLRQWSSRAPADQSLKALAFKALRYVGRQIRFRLT
jgi:glycosyltransferase involved in cell wall biosynthesis